MDEYNKRLKGIHGYAQGRDGRDGRHGDYGDRMGMNTRMERGDYIEFDEGNFNKEINVDMTNSKYFVANDDLLEEN